MSLPGIERREAVCANQLIDNCGGSLNNESSLRVLTRLTQKNR